MDILYISKVSRIENHQEIKRYLTQTEYEHIRTTDVPEWMDFVKKIGIKRKIRHRMMDVPEAIKRVISAIPKDVEYMARYGEEPYYLVKYTDKTGAIKTEKILAEKLDKYSRIVQETVYLYDKKPLADIEYAECLPSDIVAKYLKKAISRKELLQFAVDIVKIYEDDDSLDITGKCEDGVTSCADIVLNIMRAYAKAEDGDIIIIEN